jgi:hypothetical protein
MMGTKWEYTTEIGTFEGTNELLGALMRWAERGGRRSA